jgi:hypothetical protein
VTSDGGNLAVRGDGQTRRSGLATDGERNSDPDMMKELLLPSEK